MPYMIVSENGKHCVHKQTEDKKAGDLVSGGCHATEEEAKKHMSALYANVKDSLVEMSMRITKASYNKSEKSPMKWAAIDSDIDEDLYQEKMSLELYQDFEKRIKDNTPIPEEFQEAICETDWCGGMPYLSIAHFKSGEGKVNVPGEVESLFIDGTRLKSKGTLHDNALGRKVFDALREDLYMEKSGNAEHLPVRISIGFLDLEHKHRSQTGTPEFTFVRDVYGKICPLCSQGIGGKIYTKGHLIHLAMTRVPVNPRTQMSVERSMDEITTKRKDAESIVGELADGLEEKSIPSDMLVIRSDEDGTSPVEVSSPLDIAGCYDPNTDSFNQECIDAIMKKYMGDVRNDFVTPVKSGTDVVEDAKRKDVSNSDKKRAEGKYGDVSYADEENKKYPIDTEEHIRAAWNYIHQQRNADKYPDKGAAIKKKILAAWKKKIGGEPPSAKEKSLMEATMSDEVDKGVLGIPEKKFEYAGISGDGNNVEASPVKAKKSDDEEEDAKDKGDDEMNEKSALDSTFETLKSVLRGQKTAEEVQAVFNQLAHEVEKSYTPAPPTAQDISDIVRSAITDAIKPLAVELATLKAQVAKGSAVPAQAGVVASKAITANGVRPEDLLLKSQTNGVPNKKLSQIERLAYKSTGALKE